MANWLSNLLGITTPKQRIEIIQRDPCRLSLKDWQSQPAMVAMAQKVLLDPQFKLMLDCAQFEHPGHEVLINAPPDARLAQQLRGEGYTMALANLAAMGKAVKPQELLEPTFEQPEELAE